MHNKKRLPEAFYKGERVVFFFEINQTFLTFNLFSMHR